MHGEHIHIVWWGSRHCFGRFSGLSGLLLFTLSTWFMLLNGGVLVWGERGVVFQGPAMLADQIVRCGRGHSTGGCLRERQSSEDWEPLSEPVVRSENGGRTGPFALKRLSWGSTKERT
jgi:hypothetical protein